MHTSPMFFEIACNMNILVGTNFRVVDDIPTCFEVLYSCGNQQYTSNRHVTFMAKHMYIILVMTVFQCAEFDGNNGCDVPRTMAMSKPAAEPISDELIKRPVAKFFSPILKQQVDTVTVSGIATVEALDRNTADACI